MSKVTLTKTTFTSGEIDPALYGRIDLRAYEEGAARLRNVVVERTGGVSRRPGSEHVAALPSGGRLFSFELGAIHDLLVFGDGEIHVVSEGQIRQTLAGMPWPIGEVPQLNIALVDEAVLVCHPSERPRVLRRDAAGLWSSAVLEFTPFNTDDEDERRAMPFARFAPADVALQAVRMDGDPTEAGSRLRTVELRSSAPVFDRGYSAGVIFRLKGRQLRVFQIAPDGNGMIAYALTLEPLVDELATTDWDEEAFSNVHGWPIAAAMHQNRLVLGGCRDRADQIWFSRSGRPFDFDLADGVDDAAIAFRIGAERRHEIRQLFSGRVLQVFTTAGEWTIGGFPLTPSNARVELQTRVGSLAERQVAPVDVDGATLFVGGTGRDLREFLFTDTEQAYQAADVAILSRHLMREPIDMVFDQARRVFWIVRADGRFCAVTIDRNSNVVAWSLEETLGAVRAMAIHAGEVFMLAERASGLALERMADTALLDGARRLEAAAPSQSWEGLEDLAGGRYAIIADGVFEGEVDILADTLFLARPAAVLEIGHGFSSLVEGLPVVAGSGRGVALDAPYRPVRVGLRLGSVDPLRLDTGDGPRLVGFGGDGGMSGVLDLSVRARGWRRGTSMPPWRVEQGDPAPLRLLSVTVEAKVNV